MSNQLPTQTFEPMPPMPQQQQYPYAVPPVPLTKRRWFLPVAVAVGVLLGSLVTGTVNAVAATAKTANCKVAFEHADTALNSAMNVITILGDGMQSAARLDASALEDIGPKIDAEGSKIDAVTEEFKTARELCEK